MEKKWPKPIKALFVGECPAVEMIAEAETIHCLLDAGSHVILFSKTFFDRHFKEHQKEEKTNINWLKLKASNGLKILDVG